MALLAGCAGPPYFESDAFARTHPEAADLAVMSLTQGCPVNGAPADHLRKSLGSPDIRKANDSSGAVWRFKLDNASTLKAVVHGDTVVRWDVAGMPSARIASPNYSWSIAQARGFPRRVVEYLVSNPGVGPRTAFLMFRGCASPGLTGEAVRASWGRPSEINTSGDTTRWIYGFGVEGQHDVIVLVSDTVRAFDSVGWTPD